jgi:DNA polymerase-3 subunit delta'
MENNINDIFEELSDAMYHIERNGDAKNYFNRL